MSTKDNREQESIVPGEPAITDIAHFEYSVPSEGIVVVRNTKYNDKNHTYPVNVDESGETLRCGCKADVHHPGPCKHRQAVERQPAVVLAATTERDQ